MNISSCFIWMYEYIFISLHSKTKQYNKQKYKDYEKVNKYRSVERVS